MFNISYIFLCTIVLLSSAQWLAAQHYEQLSTSRHQSESKVSYLLLKNSEQQPVDPYLALEAKELQLYWSEPRENYLTELQSVQFLLSHLGHVTVHVMLVGNYPHSSAVWSGYLNVELSR